MTKPQIKKIQAALLAKGFNPGKIDGVWGRRTEAAVVAFKKSIGLRPRPYLGPITLGALMEGRPAQPQVIEGEPKWLRNARSYIGLREYKGRSHNKKILKWWKLIKMGFDDDETPWCAAFVGGTLEEVGIRSTRSGMARSFEKNWGRKLEAPAVGCVITFWRKSKSSGSGHVAYVVGRDQHGRLMCLGGNQGDAVNVKAFSDSRVTGYYWPKNVKAQPCFKLPRVGSDGTVSRNEA